MKYWMTIEELKQSGWQGDVCSYDRNYLGIAQPMCADVHVLAVQFDIPISEKNWQSMTIEQRIEHYKTEFSKRIDMTLAEIERHTKRYCEKIKLPKEEDENT